MTKAKQLLKLGREAIGHGCRYSEYSGPGRRRIGYECSDRNGEFGKLVELVRNAGFGREVNLINAYNDGFIRIMYPTSYREEVL